MTFSDKSRYASILQKNTHKGQDTETSYIKIYQNTQDLSVLEGNSYSGYQIMRIFQDNFRKGVKYKAQIAGHHAEFRKQEKFTDQYSLSISYLNTDYLNLDRTSGSGKNNEKVKLVQTK